jgi:hypothetical protein
MDKGGKKNAATASRGSARDCLLRPLSRVVAETRRIVAGVSAVGCPGGELPTGNSFSFYDDSWRDDARFDR